MEITNKQFVQHVPGEPGTCRTSTASFFGLAGICECRAVVHEATHAVQDWSNVVSIDKYIETDAYIAEGLAYSNLNNSGLGASLAREALDKVGDIVKSGDDLQARRSLWRNAYEDLAKDIGNDPLYLQSQDKSVDFTEKPATPRKWIRFFRLSLPSANPAPKIQRRARHGWHAFTRPSETWRHRKKPVGRG